jgi:hypothetical protein
VASSSSVTVSQRSQTRSSQQAGSPPRSATARSSPVRHAPAVPGGAAAAAGANAAHVTRCCETEEMRSIGSRSCGTRCPSCWATSVDRVVDAVLPLRSSRIRLWLRSVVIPVGSGPMSQVRRLGDNRAGRPLRASVVAQTAYNLSAGTGVAVAALQAEHIAVGVLERCLDIATEQDDVVEPGDAHGVMVERARGDVRAVPAIRWRCCGSRRRRGSARRWSWGTSR